NAYYASVDAVLPDRPRFCPVCGEDAPVGAEPEANHLYADNGVLLIGCEGHRAQDPNTFGIPDPRWHKRLPLVGLIEIARRSGVRRGVVTDWRRLHPDFPSPVAQLKIGPVFWWPDDR